MLSRDEETIMVFSIYPKETFISLCLGPEVCKKQCS